MSHAEVLATTTPKLKQGTRFTRIVSLWALVAALPLYLQLSLHQKVPVIVPHAFLDNVPPAPVALVVTITGCSDFPLDAAAVLQYSLLNTTSRYSYQFYAIYHPSASVCAQSLQPLGFKLLERETPVNVSEIEGEYLRNRLPKSGCCGEKELIKFEAFRLTQHAVVVLLDMDVLILKPLDDLIEMILHNRRPTDDQKHLMWPERELPSNIWLLYVNDYGMVDPGTPVKPAQGGFTILKPNVTIYEDIKAIVRQGDFDPDMGWSNLTSVFWGATTFQGLIPLYFSILYPGYTVELHWCTHNNMNAAPRDPVVLINNETVDLCRTDQDDCEDCRARSIDDVYSVHFTNCQKPWTCLPQEHLNPNTQLCRAMHRRWFRTRSEMERSWGRPGHGNGTGDFETKFFGYCYEYHGGYETIRQPYGLP